MDASFASVRRANCLPLLILWNRSAACNRKSSDTAPLTALFCVSDFKPNSSRPTRLLTQFRIPIPILCTRFWRVWTVFERRPTQRCCVGRRSSWIGPRKTSSERTCALAGRTERGCKQLAAAGRGTRPLSEPTCAQSVRRSEQIWPILLSFTFAASSALCLSSAPFELCVCVCASFGLQNLAAGVCVRRAQVL